MEITTDLIIFICIQIFNVISSTIKTVATVKSSPTTAAIINALNYTISAVITKLITEQDFYTIIIVTFFTNLLGVPIGRWIIDKCTKDRLFVFNITLTGDKNKVDDFKNLLKQKNIDCIYETIIENKRYSLQVFSSSKEESKIIKMLISLHNAKYYVIETH